MAAPKKPEFLLILAPWDPPAEFISALSAISPGSQIESRITEYYSTEIPKDISTETWKKVTILFTWKTFPPKELVPNLEYVQLLSAGCNQIMGLDLFKETDIAFCTANGVHPPQITEWVFSTFFAFQHYIPKYLKYQAQRKWVLPESDEDTEDAVGLRVYVNFSKISVTLDRSIFLTQEQRNTRLWQHRPTVRPCCQSIRYGRSGLHSAST